MFKDYETDNAMDKNDNDILYEKPYIKRDITRLEMIDRMHNLIAKTWKHGYKLDTKK